METTSVLEYKCPNCGATLSFGGESQRMSCEYCGSSFALEAILETQKDDTQLTWEQEEKQRWSEAEQSQVRAFRCDACGGELITDKHTAATFCPYCGNAAILPGRLQGGLKPEGVIPFKTTREDAEAAFKKLCQGKPLLPKLFTQEQQLEKITGLYVPFWLYDCEANLHGSYKATRSRTWSDSRFIYTKTDHFLLQRQADAAFSGIPMDGSSKMSDSFMESIEPFDYTAMVDFETAYLSGYLADKYDVEATAGEGRIRQRVENSMNDEVQASFAGYNTVIPTSRQILIHHSRAKYVLLPVWMMNVKYQGKVYTFAMNGQTGRMTGSFPICPKRSAAWFLGLWAASAAIVSLIQLIF